MWRALVVVVVIAGFLAVWPVAANPPAPGDESRPTIIDWSGSATGFKPIDEPNPLDSARLKERQRLLEAHQAAEADALALSGSDRALVILVEFAGTDVFTWTAGVSTWDPVGKADPSEAVTDSNGNVIQGNCSKIITQTAVFTYSPLLHNQIPRPISAADSSGTMIWTPDFSPNWFNSFLFGNGVTFNYTRTDGSRVDEDLTGKSVRNYYVDLSNGAYNLAGDVIGWLQLPHSAWWYGADPCPGARSGTLGGFPASGAIPNAGNANTLVMDALNAVNAISPTIPGFSWKNYDLNGDGVIDRLWIVHAGYGEEDSTTLLNRTNYREAALWSSAYSIPAYPVGEGISAGPYILMPENGGIGVFAHEVAHNLGAADLYAASGGDASAGFWTLMADDWTGYPIGFLPPSMDPLHLDLWGWLSPVTITDTSQVYTLTLGQTSAFPIGAGVYRGAKIPLPDKAYTLPVSVWDGSYYWWGGKEDNAQATLTTRNPIVLTGATTATLSFDIAYDLELDADYLQTQLSTDGGVNWSPITNTDATFKNGLTGKNIGWPAPVQERFDLTAYVGHSILLRFAYVTDDNILGEGPFLDNVRVATDAYPFLFFDDAENGDARWIVQSPWVRSDGIRFTSQNYYVQWRNVGKNGGYDSALGDSRYRFGPANTGLLVWYNDNYYADNEISRHLQDRPSFGPKGKLLIVDSHPEPYRDPYRVEAGYLNSIANVTRASMRDAPFSRKRTVSFTLNSPYVVTTTVFADRPTVSTFSDDAGYYPGLEYARRGVLPCTTFQVYDRQWDASAVVPARSLYSTKMTGGPLTTTTDIRIQGSIKSSGDCQAAWAGLWHVPYADAANTGDPADSNADYGWRVQIVDQTDITATLKIWNTHVFGALSADKTTAQIDDVVRYTYAMTGYQGNSMALVACVPLDINQVQYVTGSATSGAVPLSTSCDALTSAIEPTSIDAPITAIRWAGPVPHGGNVTFGFSVKIKAFGLIDQSIRLYKEGVYWVSLPAQPIDIAIKIYLPMILKQ